MTALLGTVVEERYRYQLGDLLPLLQSWCQDAGGFALIVLGLWIVYRLRTPVDLEGRRRGRVSPVQAALAGLSAVCYLAAMAMFFAGVGVEDVSAVAAVGAPQLKTGPLALVATAGGLLAIIGALEPIARDAARLRWRRIWALASITFREAIRKRTILVFCVFMVIFLFPPQWFGVDNKGEDELRVNVKVIFTAMTPILLLAAMLLAAFSIPADVRSQAIHTIVTKPVERFEIVLGRFLGFGGLLTGVLLAASAVSMLSILFTSIDEAAQRETYKARQVVYGRLGYRREGDLTYRGVSVGREWEYRRYVAGPPPRSAPNSPPEYAIWSFYDRDLSGGLADRPVERFVPMEFEFDIFRTTRGEREQGVDVTFRAVTHNWKDYSWRWEDSELERQFQRAADVDFRRRGGIRPGESPEAWKKVNALAKEYGFFEINTVEVFDYHTLAAALPPGLFENALEGDPGEDSNGNPLPRLRVLVKMESRNQYLGVAPKDLYLLESDGSFYLNFLKGAFGLWCRLMIVTGVAVAVSTYLNGVVSFLLVSFLLIAGLFREFIIELAEGRSVGGGSAEAVLRLVKGKSLGIKLDDTTGIGIARGFDAVNEWFIRRVVSVIPDVDRFSWSEYVAEGFNVPFGSVVMNSALTLGYLAPWFVLGYYLIKTREVATW